MQVLAKQLIPLKKTFIFAQEWTRKNRPKNPINPLVWHKRRTQNFGDILLTD